MIATLTNSSGGNINVAAVAEDGSQLSQGEKD